MASLCNCGECPLYPTINPEAPEKISFRDEDAWVKVPLKPLKYLIPPYQGNIVFVADYPHLRDLSSTPQKFFSGSLMTMLKDEFTSHGICIKAESLIAALHCHVNKKPQKRYSRSQKGMVVDDRISVFTNKDITNALKCCRPDVVAAIQAKAPKLIIPFGDVALRQITKGSGIGKHRGKLVWSEEFNCWVFPMYHPLMVELDQANLPFFKADIAQAAQFIKDGFQPKSLDQSEIYEDVESIQFLLDKKDIIVAIDTETQGADWCNHDSEVISYSITDDIGRGYNVWLNREVDSREESTHQIFWERRVQVETPKGKTKTQQQMVRIWVQRDPNYQQKIEELRQICLREDIKIVMMNGNYDIHRLIQLGIKREEIKKYVLDIQTGMHTLDPDNFKNASMLNIQRVLLPSRQDHKTAFGSTVDKGDMLKAAKEDPKRHTDYSSADVCSTLECAQIISGKLKEDPLLARYYTKLVHPVETEIMMDIERNGMLFDKKKLPIVYEEVAELINRQEQEIIALIPRKIKDKHREKGLKLSRGDFLRDALFSKDGFGLTPLELTPTGEAALGIKILAQIKDTLTEGTPEYEMLTKHIERNPYVKLFSTYLKGFEKALKQDNMFHTQIHMTYTSTGRSGCIRKGSLVETVRDIAACPLGTPIEDVKPGDCVYSYDNNGLPTIKKVIAKAMTGVRELIRIHLRNVKGDSRGYLDLTPEHRVRLSNGEYIEAQNLQPNMSVCSVYRTVHHTGYSKLWLTNRGAVNEHRFIFATLNGPLSAEQAVHHIDGNKLNNHPDNLEALYPSEHTARHAEQGDIPSLPRFAVTLGRNKLLRMFARAKGRPTKMGHDFGSIKRAMLDTGIDWFQASKRYNRRGEFLSRGKVKASLAMTGNQILEFLGVGYYRWKELMAFYGLSRDRKWGNQSGPFTPRIGNHLVSSVEWLNIEDEVYDLEVEGTHNFVVGGISVHNSRSPNLQNIPKRNPAISKMIRKLFVAPEGKVLVTCDLSQAELRFIAHASGDPVFNKVYNNGEDIHTNTAHALIKMQGHDPLLCTKEQLKHNRQTAKSCNFGYVYGMQAKKFQTFALQEYSVRISLTEAIAFKETFFNLYGGLNAWHEHSIMEARKHGLTRSVFGGIRRVPNINSNDFQKRSEDERISINTPIQSASNSWCLFAALHAKRTGVYDNRRASLVIFIHDELGFYVDEDYVDVFVPRLVDAMEHPPVKETFGLTLSCPMVAEASYGDSLGTLKPWGEE